MITRSFTMAMTMTLVSAFLGVCWFCDRRDMRSDYDDTTAELRLKLADAQRDRESTQQELDIFVEDSMKSSDERRNLKARLNLSDSQVLYWKGRFTELERQASSFAVCYR